MTLKGCRREDSDQGLRLIGNGTRKSSKRSKRMNKTRNKKNKNKKTRNNKMYTK